MFVSWPRTRMHVSIHMRVPRQTHGCRGLALSFCFQFPPALSWQYSLTWQLPLVLILFLPHVEGPAESCTPGDSSSSSEMGTQPGGVPPLDPRSRGTRSGSLPLQRSEARSVGSALFLSSLAALNLSASLPSPAPRGTAPHRHSHHGTSLFPFCAFDLPVRPVSPFLFP